MQKTILTILLFSSALLGLTGCGGDGDDNNSMSTDARPTNWVPVTTDVDLRSTMTIDVGISLSNLYLNYQSSSTDLVAAFINGTCRAVASPQTNEETGENIFYLTVKRLTNDESDAPVTLKFYSTQHRHIFTSTGLTYQPDAIIGTFDDPNKPVWTK